MWAAEKECTQNARINFSAFLPGLHKRYAMPPPGSCGIVLFVLFCRFALLGRQSAPTPLQTAFGRRTTGRAYSQPCTRL